ncbi:MAG: DUF5319 family protein [bacterium]
MSGTQPADAGGPGSRGDHAGPEAVPAGAIPGPLDPFLDDDQDPTDLLDPVDPPAPLTESERADVAADLRELQEFAAALAPRGIRGVVVDCTDCGEPHYFSWALMEVNLRTLLGVGTANAHEPAVDPDPSGFVSWDYARGYTDALSRR